MGRKWANIVAKTAKDGATSNIYAKFGVEIYVAAKQGEPDPESNSSLKFVIERAKQAQVPKHVIDKAIDKAKGGGDETFVQGRYEGFGPNGSMIIAETLTSNVNRTIANVRTIFNKKAGVSERQALSAICLTILASLYLQEQIQTVFLKFCLMLKLMFVM